MAQQGGRVAVVTGSSRGIGAAIARRLGAAGFNVVVNFASGEKAALEVVGAIRSAGGQAIAVGANMTKEEDVVRLYERAHQEWGRLDVVVNNAAILACRPIEQLNRADFMALIDTNLWGMLVSCREAAKRFGPEGGKILNLSSSNAKQGFHSFTEYASTKGAIESATRSLAVELAPRKITVNAIAPGGTLTDMMTPFGQMGIDMVAKGTPLGRIGVPEDISGVVAFMASADAGWITGQVISVNGGMVMS